MAKYFSDENYFMRPVGRDDLPMLAEHRNSQDTWNGLTDIFPKWEHQQEAWLASMNDFNMFFVVEDIMELEPVGMIRITDVDYVNANACVGVDVLYSFRGFGAATRIMRMIQSYCFKYLHLHHLWLLVKDDNIAAIKSYRRTGFKTEGVLREHLFRDGEFHDYILMGLLKEEWENGNTTVSSVHGG